MASPDRRIAVGSQPDRCGGPVVLRLRCVAGKLGVVRGRATGAAVSARRGHRMASRVTTIGLEFALPRGGRLRAGSWLRTMPVATVIGAVLGFLVGMLHAVRMSRELAGERRSRSRRMSAGPRRSHRTRADSERIDSTPDAIGARTPSPVRHRRVASADRGKPWLDTPTTPWATSSITTRSRSRGGTPPTLRLEDPPAARSAGSRSRGSW